MSNVLFFFVNHLMGTDKKHKRQRSTLQLVLGKLGGPRQTIKTAESYFQIYEAKREMNKMPPGEYKYTQEREILFNTPSSTLPGGEHGLN